MSGFLTIVEGGKKLLPLRQKLLVAIHVHGTIAEVSASCPVTFRPRPYLAYLLHTLRRLHCDVHFMTSLNPDTEGKAMEKFLLDHSSGGGGGDRRGSPLSSWPFQIHYEPPSRFTSSFLQTHHDTASQSAASRSLGNGGGKSWTSSPSRSSSARKHHSAASSSCCSAPLSRHSFTPPLLRRAMAQGISPDRILCVDTEVNYRFPPLQTIVLERYQYHTHRETRQAYQSYMAQQVWESTKRSRRRNIQENTNDGGASVGRPRSSPPPEEEVGGGGGGGTNAFVQHHEKERCRMMAQEAFLSDALAPLRKRGKGGEDSASDGTSLPASTPMVPIPDVTVEGIVAPLTREEEETNAKRNRHEADVEVEAQEGLSSPLSTSTSTIPTTTTTTSSSRNAEKGGGLVAFHAPLPSALLSDSLCVALATFVMELCSSSASVTVKDFLTREPLLESLRVPMHGNCFYLAKENCQDMELVDWDEVEVLEEEKNKSFEEAKLSEEDVGTSEKGGESAEVDASSVREEPDEKQVSFFQ